MRLPATSSPSRGLLARRGYPTGGALETFLALSHTATDSTMSMPSSGGRHGL
jgi:hypothetical protein